jgi:hypothetical protein
MHKVLFEIWSIETAHPSYQSSWNEQNKSCGQCCVTALLIQEIYGGKIFECFVKNKRHFFNEIDGHIYDYTIDQFQSPVEYKKVRERTRKSLLNSTDTKYRYNILYNLYLQASGG